MICESVTATIFIACSPEASWSWPAWKWRREFPRIAHSDGDVVLHAVVDALLGAMGLGDIGEMFPNTDPRWKNAASRIFVDGAMQQVVGLGFALVNVDVTVLAERPRLKAHKSQMVESLSKMVGCPVNIKAGTNEGCDAMGRGEAIAAHAVILLARKLEGTMNRTKP